LCQKTEIRRRKTVSSSFVLQVKPVYGWRKRRRRGVRSVRENCTDRMKHSNTNGVSSYNLLGQVRLSQRCIVVSGTGRDVQSYMVSSKSPPILKGTQNGRPGDLPKKQEVGDQRRKR